MQHVPMPVHDWEESEHPRVGAGSSSGGQFTAGAGGGGLETSPKNKGPVVQHEWTSPITHKKVAELYGNGMSTGSIAKELGHEASPETRKKIRAILRKAGLYKENGGLVKEQTPAITAAPKLQELVSKYWALQEAHGEKSVPLEESKKLFNEYFQSEGASTTSIKTAETNIKNWTGSVQSQGGVAWRKIAAEHYGRSWDKEHMKNHLSSGQVDQSAQASKAAILCRLMNQSILMMSRMPIGYIGETPKILRSKFSRTVIPWRRLI